MAELKSKPAPTTAAPKKKRDTSGHPKCLMRECWQPAMNPKGGLCNPCASWQWRWEHRTEHERELYVKHQTRMAGRLMTMLNVIKRGKELNV